MRIRTLVCRTLLLTVFGAGVGCAAEVFAAKVSTHADRKPGVQESEESKAADLLQDVIANLEMLAAQALQKPATAAALEHIMRDLKALIVPEPEKPAAAAADFPRELGMRPLPAYRIAPPDLIRVELIDSKAAPTSGGQSPAASEQGARPVGPESGAAQATVTGSAQSDVGAVTITSGKGNLTKTGTGTLTFSSGNTYTGSTTITAGTTILDNAKGTATYISSDSPNVSGAKLAAAAGGRQPPPSGAARPYITPQIEAAGGPSVTGIYLVGPDGTINLRRYGTVEVMGMTIAEAKAAVEKQLSKHFPSPEVTVDVAGYNSKVYYIITEGAGLGDNVVRVPITGNDTVLDAVSQIGGLSQLAGKKMWIARPSAAAPEKGTILAVDWEAITRRGAAATNYQVMPGDRILIAEDSLVALNNSIAKLSAPVERVLGLMGLGSSTINSIQKLLSPREQKDK